MWNESVVLNFITSIVPGNWLPITDPSPLLKRFGEGFKKLETDKPALLYIQIFLNNHHCEDDPRCGEVHGDIKVYQGFSTAELHLYDIGDEWEFVYSWEGTIIHELSHIAVLRWIQFRRERDKFFTFDENPHGPKFKKALRAFWERVWRLYGREKIDLCREIETEMYMY